MAEQIPESREWTLRDSAVTILKRATDAYTEANERRVRAESEECARQAAEKHWDEEHPEDGVGSFSINPYIRTRRRGAENVELAAKKAAREEKVLAFVRDKICFLLEEHT